MARPLLALLAVFVAGCSTPLATLTTTPPGASASATEVAQGDALHRFRASTGEWGFMDARGAVVVEPRFEDVSVFQEGRASVRLGERTGVIDPSGRFVVQPVYDEIGLFQSGRARVGLGEAGYRTFGYIDASGREVVAPTLPVATEFDDGLGVVRLLIGEVTGLRKLLARMGLVQSANRYVGLGVDGRVALELPHAFVGAFSEGFAPFESTRGRWGYLATDGSVAIEATFEGPAFGFTEGLARIGQGGHLGFIDRRGAYVIEPIYPAAGPFSEGLAAVLVGRQWGYVDRTGTVAIAPQFEEAGPFSEGLAAVQVGGQWGYVDAEGRMVIEPAYERAQGFRNGLALVYQGRTAFVIRHDGARVGPSDL